MFLVDTEEQRIISDEELKQQIATAFPYRQWLDDNLLHFDDLPDISDQQPSHYHHATLQRQQAFGYTFEDLRLIRKSAKVVLGRGLINAQPQPYGHKLIAPRCPRSQDPEDAVQDTTIIHPRHAARHGSPSTLDTAR
jgi:hypothetical protein